MTDDRDRDRRRRLPQVQSDADRAFAQRRRTPPAGTPAIPEEVIAEISDVQTVKRRIATCLSEDPTIADILDAVVEELIATLRKAERRSADRDIEVIAARQVGSDCCDDVAALKEWRTQVDLLHVSVFGHPPTKEPGRLGRLEERMEKQNEIVSRLDRVFWKIVGAGTAAGAVVALGAELLKGLLAH